jgi:hypothetical protein
MPLSHRVDYVDQVRGYGYRRGKSGLGPAMGPLPQGCRGEPRALFLRILHRQFRVMTLISAIIDDFRAALTLPINLNKSGSPRVAINGNF